MWNKLLPPGLLARPLAAFAVALAVGIGGGTLLHPTPEQAYLLLVIAASVTIILVLHMRRARWTPLLLLWVGLGVFLCMGEQAQLAAWPVAPDDYAVVSGQMRGAAEATDSGYVLRLRVEQVDGTDVDCADVLVSAQGELPPPNSRLEIDALCLGREYANPGVFSYADYLARQGIAAQLSAKYYGYVHVIEPGADISLAALGQWLRTRLATAESALSPEQRQLVNAVFLGEKSGLSQEQLASFSLSGLLHLFAVSGLHVGYVVALALAVAGSGYRTRRRRFLLTLALLLVYVSLTGFAASILRAVAMTLLLLLAEVLDEPVDSLNTLGLAALVCLTIHPLWLTDAGFTLSFAAVWGILTLSRPLVQICGGGNFLTQSFAVSLAATLATAPLMAYYFGYVSLVGWLIAPVAIPLAGLAVCLSFAALPLLLAWPWAAGFLLQAAGFVMQGLSAIADVVASLPWSSIGLAQMPLLVLLLCLAVVAAMPLLLTRYRQKGLLVLIPMLALMLVAQPLARSADSGLPGAVAQVMFLDVGQGDATLITTADGCSVLIDGGGSAASPGSIGQYVLLPVLQKQGVERLDLVVSTHPDVDHLDGLLSVMQYFPVDTLLVADCFAGDAQQQLLLAAATAQDCQVLNSAAGAEYSLGEYLRLSVYNPPAGDVLSNANDASLVCRFSIGAVDVLCPGDVSGARLAELAAAYALPSEIVKLPHHGSAHGYDEDFYAACGAQAVVISAGENNSYGHPAANVVEYWQQRATVLRTDEQGAIIISINGTDWQARTMQKNED